MMCEDIELVARKIINRDPRAFDPRGCRDDVGKPVWIVYRSGLDPSEPIREYQYFRTHKGVKAHFRNLQKGKHRS
jgi:hypothetical protein